MNEIGPQRAAPKSVAAINAETKQVQHELSIIDELCEPQFPEELWKAVDGAFKWQEARDARNFPTRP